METELYEKLVGAVQREARLAERRWNQIIEADDIEQEIWLFLLENKSSQRFLDTAEPAQVAAALKTRADTICSRERLDLDHFSGNYHYTPGEVRDLLEEVGAEYDVHEADDKVDLQLGLDALLQYHPEHFSILERAYWLGESFPRGSSDERRSFYAVDKLTEIMNRKRGQRERDRTEGLGTRPTLPNISEDDSSEFYKED